MKSRKLIALIMASMALMAAAGTAAADGNGIEGPWRVTITPIDCATGTPFPQFAVLSYLTFGSGGTLGETTSSLSFQPNQRSPGHGYWEYSGSQTYHAYFEAFIRFDSQDPAPPARPYQRGVQSVDQSIAMTDRDHWVSDAFVRFQDTSGQTIPPTGCARAAAERVR